MSAATDELTRAYRRQQLALRALTTRELLLMWRLLDRERVDETFPAFAQAVAGLIQRRRVQASGIASGFLRAHRLASGVAGSPVIERAGPAPAEKLATSLHVTGPVAIKRGMRNGKDAQAAEASAVVLVAGAVARHVLDAGRETIMQSTIADPSALGWTRNTSPNACGFCKMLAGRAEDDEFYSESTADFGAHDHCICSAIPVYEGRGLSEHERMVRGYAPSARGRNVSPVSRETVRTYL